MKSFIKILIFSVIIILSEKISADQLFCNSKIYQQIQNSISDSIVKLPVPGSIELKVINKNWIMISRIPQWSGKTDKFISSPVLPGNAENILMYRLINNKTNQSIPIIGAGLKRRVLLAVNPVRRKDFRVKEEIFLHSSVSLKKNNSYSIKTDSRLFGTIFEKEFKFTPHKNISSIAHIDPYGFRTNDQKKVYFGLNMGSAGEIIPDRNFEVINLKNDKTVFKGKADSKLYEGWPAFIGNKPYSNVLEGNFSEIEKSGQYIIKHASGYSLPFLISDNAYRITLNTLTLGMYNQRRGEAILERYSRFARKSTIENNSYVYNSDKLDFFVKKLINKLPKNEIKIKYPTKLEGKKYHFDSAGHMDAGDYSPYTYNSSLLVYFMITTLDFYKDKVFHDNLGIPESGDGIPDLLQEMMIELNWLKGMQDYQDGGVFFMSKPYGMAYQSTMPGKNKSLTRYLAPKDTTATGAYAAALARAARSPILKKYYPNLNKELESNAERAWYWLEKNSGLFGYHHYGIENKEKDERVWAALELYALTGKEKYRKYFENNHKPELRAHGVEWMNHSYGNANRTVALWDHDKIKYPITESFKKKCQSRYHNYISLSVKNAKKMPYNLSFHDAYKRFYTIGWFFPVSAYSWDLLLGFYLYDNQEYMNTALDQIHYTLGANPLDKTFITGLGYNRIMEIVDQKSLYDKIEEPVTGIPVSPVVTGFTYLKPYGKALNDLTYPRAKYDTSIKNWKSISWDVYGILELPYDGWNIKAEMTIEKLAKMLCCAAIITPVTKKQYEYPEFEIKVERIKGRLSKSSIKFNKYPDYSYFIMWYNNGIPISCNPYILTPENGIFTKRIIGAEVITEQGRRKYKEITL